VQLSDRLTARLGSHYVPGIQALVRFPLEQARLDRAAGLRIATFISGYPGSPLAGYDLALARVPDLLAEHDVTFVPAGNEELAATAHMGTQMLDGHPHNRRPVSRRTEHSRECLTVKQTGERILKEGQMDR
jgi:indolepyruvate ferredoxin oxidoreductase